ncbi:hypothetical protein IKG12_02205 [Candidatus Saccharibacteria bacterium]|nr:hypothetical protein [Candidatus Saccharibacteria bacterium]MBR3233654.1 hypothetical protein [Candidatus Saccharibacteria bacterium]
MYKGHIKDDFVILKSIITKFFKANPAVEKVAIFAASLVVGITLGSTIDLAKNASAESYISATSETAISETKSYTEIPTPEKANISAIQQVNEYTQPKTGAGILYMPSIGLYRGISYVAKGVNPQNVIDSGAIAAYAGNVLLAHNPGSFSGLVNIYNSFSSGANITFNYNGRDYTVYDAEIASHNGKQYMTKYGARSLNRLSETNALVLVTCYGNQRIMIYAR